MQSIAFVVVMFPLLQVLFSNAAVLDIGIKTLLFSKSQTLHLFHIWFRKQFYDT